MNILTEAIRALLRIEPDLTPSIEESFPGVSIEGMLSQSEESLQRPAFITSSLSTSDIHNNGALVSFEEDKRKDEVWSRNNNIFTHTGPANNVTINVSINAVDGGASNYWSRPKLRLLRNDEVIAVFDDLVMQQNNAYDGDATFSALFIDTTPEDSPSYKFEWFDKENRTATLIPQPYSQITLKAEY